jgi:hypothetical protein
MFLCNVWSNLSDYTASQLQICRTREENMVRYTAALTALNCYSTHNALITTLNKSPRLWCPGQTFKRQAGNRLFPYPSSVSPDERCHSILQQTLTGSFHIP